MRFLESSEIELWCADRGVVLSPGEQPVAPDPRLAHRVRTVFAGGTRSGREFTVAAAAVRALGEWDECLLWITLVGVWPSGEDWPGYYALRGSQGERRSLDQAPGHLFSASERATLEQYVATAMENGWDAFVLPSRGAQAPEVRLRVSHDEWAELQGREPVEFGAPAV